MVLAVLAFPSTAVAADPPGGEGATAGQSEACGGGLLGKACDLGKAITDPGATLGNAAAGIAADAFDRMAQKFADSATWLLQQLSTVFFESSTVDLDESGVRSVLLLTTPLAALAALLLLLWATGSAAFASDGSRLATAVVGLFKTVLVTAMIVTVAQVSLKAADEVSAWIVDRTLGGPDQLQERLGHLVEFSALSSPGLLLIFALIACIVVMILWCELLLRHVGIVLLVAAAPIAAAGLVGQSTAQWWVKARNALLHLILLKPVIALCFAIGFAELGGASDVLGLLAGLVTLGLAAIAWPVLAKFLTFTAVGGGAGLVSGLVGTAAGFGIGRTSGGAPTSGPAASWGPGLATATERENDGLLTQRAARSGWAGATVASGGALTAVAAVTKAAAITVDHLESSVSNMAAHAELGNAHFPRNYYGAPLPPMRRRWSAPTAPVSPDASTAPPGPMPSEPPAPEPSDEEER